MNKEELVERVAIRMYYQHVPSGFKWEKETQWFRDKYLGYAREVLNDPDLAWIDRGIVLHRFTSLGLSDDYIAGTRRVQEAIIPLAEALRKVEEW